MKQTSEIKKVVNIVSLLVIFISSCNINNVDYKNPVGVSTSIQESKKNNVFLKTLEFGNIQFFNENYNFPIDEIWLENSWHLEINANGEEKIIIDKTKPLNLVFLLYENTKLSKQNLLNEWVLWEGAKKTPCSVISGMPIIPVADTSEINTTHFTIYLQKTPNDFKRDIVKLFTFNLNL